MPIMPKLLKLGGFPSVSFLLIGPIIYFSWYPKLN